MSRLQGQNEIRNTEDIIDSRDVIARISYLEDEKESFEGTAYESEDVPGKFGFVGCESDDFETLEEAKEAEYDEGDEGQELKALLALQEEAEGYSSDWRYGSTLIRDSYFEEYAQQLAEDIGAIDKAASWPNTCIDWKQAAEELQQDYTSVSFDGVDYWIR